MKYNVSVIEIWSERGLVWNDLSMSMKDEE